MPNRRTGRWVYASQDQSVLVMKLPARVPLDDRAEQRTRSGWFPVRPALAEIPLHVGEPAHLSQSATSFE